MIKCLQITAFEVDVIKWGENIPILMRIPYI